MQPIHHLLKRRGKESGHPSPKCWLFGGRGEGKERRQHPWQMMARFAPENELGWQSFFFSFFLRVDGWVWNGGWIDGCWCQNRALSSSSSSSSSPKITPAAGFLYGKLAVANLFVGKEFWTTHPPFPRKCSCWPWAEVHFFFFYLDDEQLSVVKKAIFWRLFAKTKEKLGKLFDFFCFEVGAPSILSLKGEREVFFLLTLIWQSTRRIGTKTLLLWLSVHCHKSGEERKNGKERGGGRTSGRFL